MVQSGAWPTARCGCSRSPTRSRSTRCGGRDVWPIAGMRSTSCPTVSPSARRTPPGCTHPRRPHARRDHPGQGRAPAAVRRRHPQPLPARADRRRARARHRAIRLLGRAGRRAPLRCQPVGARRAGRRQAGAGQTEPGSQGVRCRRLGRRQLGGDRGCRDRGRGRPRADHAHPLAYPAGRLRAERATRPVCAASWAFPTTRWW